MNKNTHGGKREGAGRKPAPEPEFIKKFRANEDERKRFMSFMTGDARKDFELVLLALDMLKETKTRLQSKIREKHQNDR